LFDCGLVLDRLRDDVAFVRAVDWINPTVRGALHVLGRYPSPEM
jgi:hypothetical protein